jgi:hypothetical protein
MKKTYLMLWISLFYITGAMAQSFEWAKREGLWAYDYGYGVVTDQAGNIYVSGKYEMNANFSGTVVSCAGNHDMYVAKYSPSGALIWIKTAGGDAGDYAHNLMIDGNSLYVTGEFENTASFGSTTLTAVGDNDIFIAKYDLNGNLIWVRKAGGGGNDRALSASADAQGNVYICGHFSGTANFGGNWITGYGDKDIYVAKYNANGDFQWVNKAGSALRDEALAVKADASGNVYVTGMFKDGATFGSNTLSSKGYWDMFLAKYNTAGALLWVVKGGGDWDDVGWDIAMDNGGKIYVAGEFNAYATFGSQSLTTAGNSDVFVACYDASGNTQWLRRAGGDLIDRVRGLSCDGSNLYITGQFGASAGFGSTTLNAADSSDIFVAALDNSGNFKWALAVGGRADSVETLGYESGNSICTDGAGNVYVTGAVLDNGVFGGTTLETYSRTDMFLTKIVQGPLSVTAAKAAQNVISLFPNPASGFVMVRSSEELSGDVQLSLFNALGERLLYKNYNGFSSQELDISQYAKGVYILQLKSKDAETNLRLVVK